MYFLRTSFLRPAPCEENTAVYRSVSTVMSLAARAPWGATASDWATVADAIKGAAAATCTACFEAEDSTACLADELPAGSGLAEGKIKE